MDRGQRARQRLAAQNGAVRALVEAGTLEEAIPALLGEVCVNLGWSRGELWCPAGPDDPELRLRIAWTDPGASAAPSIGPELAARAARSHRPIWATNADRASLGVPVPLGGDRCAALLFVTRSAPDEDADLMETMAAVGGYLGQFMRRRSAEAELQASEERLRFQGRLLDAVAEAVIATDLDGRILYWNAAAERMYGWAADEVEGRPVDEVTPAVEARAEAERLMDRLRAGESWSGEIRVRDRAGREFPALVNNSPIQDATGRLIGVIGTSMEITARKREEEGQRFLAEAGRVLASSLDYETTLGSVADLAVPMLGDWCQVHSRAAGEDAARPVARAGVGGQLHAAETLMAALAEETGFMAAVVEAGGAVIERRDHESDALGAVRLRDYDVRELLAAPLPARGSALGVLAFAITRSDRRYDAMDARFAEELARRAALALDNARLYRDAQKANRAKADFLAVISHELRTPLNAIMGYADLLAGGVAGELGQDAVRHVDRIKVGAGHLAQIIDEVLAYARLESGREMLRLETTDLGQVAREAAVVVQPDAMEQGLPIHIDVDSPPPTVVTDAGKVRQVLVNLLINAVKYTDEGEIRVDVRRVDDGARLTVSDTGTGIASEQQERIFEPFIQAEAPNTRTVGGTGLGLSVNRRLLDILGGSISVDSEVGVGSTFTVWLPLEADR